MILSTVPGRVTLGFSGISKMASTKP
jgi:hypothetical protein